MKTMTAAEIAEMTTERDSIQQQIRENAQAAGSRSAAREVNAPLKHRAMVLAHILDVMQYSDEGNRAVAIEEVRGAAQRGFATAAAAEALEILGC